MVTQQTWQQVRDAYLLGATLKEAAERYGVSYEAARSRSSREKWPNPHKVKPEALSTFPPAEAVAADSLAKRGEAHRLRIAALVEQALAAALPPALNNWQDIERAAKLGDRAFGLENTAQPIVNLAFPQILSSESPAFIEISTNSGAEASRDPPTEGGPPSLE